MDHFHSIRVQKLNDQHHPDEYQEEYHWNISTVKLALFIYKADYMYSTGTGCLEGGRGGGSLTAVLDTHVTSKAPEFKGKLTTLVKNTLKLYTHIYKNKMTLTAHNWLRWRDFPSKHLLLFRLRVLDECFRIEKGARFGYTADLRTDHTDHTLLFSRSCNTVVTNVNTVCNTSRASWELILFSSLTIYGTLIFI